MTKTVMSTLDDKIGLATDCIEYIDYLAGKMKISALVPVKTQTPLKVGWPMSYRGMSVNAADLLSDVVDNIGNPKIEKVFWWATNNFPQGQVPLLFWRNSNGYNSHKFCLEISIANMMIVIYPVIFR